ncbi:MAG: tetratricopeptide repeat protein [Acidobacteria bacterium]|nr:tetratricopeptide repeat protein [Acidobacteriota bacterium]
MRTNLRRALLVIAVVLAASVPAFAQGIVRGTVVDAEGKPVEGATVLIENVASGRKAETKTDRSGSFLQVGMSSGGYTVTATKDTLTATLKANVGQARPAVLQFTLTRTSGLSPAEAKAQAAMAALATSALASLKAGNDDEAIRQFNEIVATIPTCADCYYNLGMAYAKKQQYPQAEAAFLKVTELRPDSGEAFAGLANVYNAQKKYDLAAAAGAKAQSLAGSGGGSAEATYNNGVILFNSQKFAEAKTQFEAAVKIDPNMAMAQYQLGMTSLNLGDIALAVSSLEAYMKIDPTGPKSAEVKTALPALQGMLPK